MSVERPVIGYTLGDQAGIGPEVIRAALEPLPNSAEYRLMGKEVPCTPGCPTEDTAKAAQEHLELAAEALRSGSIDAVVTAPICKEALHRLGFNYPGQTEFFADRLGSGLSAPIEAIGSAPVFAIGRMLPRISSKV